MAKKSRGKSKDSMIETMTLLPPNIRGFIGNYVNKTGDTMSSFIRRATIYYIQNNLEKHYNEYNNSSKESL